MRTASISTLALLVLVGCGGNGSTAPDAASARPVCDEIMHRCHEFDTGSGEIHECHETSEAMDTTNEECVAIRDHCFEICVASDAGVEGDSGHAHDEDGGH